MTTEEGMSALKAAELELRKAVEVHGTHHPAVLAQLESYVRLCRQHGQDAQAEKLEAKAAILRKALGTLGESVGTAAPGAVAAAQSAQPNAPTPTPAPAPAGLPQAASGISPAPAVPPAAASAAASAAAPAAHTAELEPAAAPALAAQVQEFDRYTEKHLFNSKGEHIAVAFDGDLYSPNGQHLARWEADLNAYVDDRGWYFGEIVDGDRIARDPNWHYRHMNFGTKATAGNRSGWQRQSDTSRADLPFGYADIVFPED
jgi:hypothetical protein